MDRENVISHFSNTILFIFLSILSKNRQGSRRRCYR